MTDKTRTTEPDVLRDLERMWPHFAGVMVGAERMNYKPGEISAVMILAAEEIRRLRGWLDYIGGNFRDHRACAEEALRGDELPDGFGVMADFNQRGRHDG